MTGARARVFQTVITSSHDNLIIVWKYNSARRHSNAFRTSTFFRSQTCRKSFGTFIIAHERPSPSGNHVRVRVSVFYFIQRRVQRGSRTLSLLRRGGGEWLKNAPSDDAGLTFVVKRGRYEEREIAMLR